LPPLDGIGDRLVDPLVDSDVLGPTGQPHPDHREAAGVETAIERILEDRTPGIGTDVVDRPAAGGGHRGRVG
jgi:hypothetical protein